MKRFSGTTVLSALALRTDKFRIAVWSVLVAAATLLLAWGGSTAHLTDHVAEVTMVTVAVMSVLLVTPHLRGAEQSGCAELARTGVVGRFASTIAGLSSAVVANMCVCALLTVAFVSAGFGAAGSFTVAVGVLMVGLVFTALSALTSQIFEDARYSNAAALGGVAGAYLVHVIGDALHSGDRSVVGWLSPFTWAHATHAFDAPRWWPVLLGVTVVVLLLGTTSWSLTHRDHGFGFALSRRVAEPAPSNEPDTGVLPFVLGQLWWPLSTWCPVVVGIGLAVGGFGAHVPGFSASERSPEDAFVLWLTLLAVLAGACALSAVTGMVRDESVGRTDAVLSAPISRVRWFGAQSAVIAGGAFAVLLLGGTALSVTATSTLGDVDSLWRLLIATTAQLPPLFTVLGAAAWCYGHAPRALSVLWGWLAYIVLVTLAGELLPAWAGLLSPFERSPLDGFSPGTALILVAIGAVLTVLGAEGFRRRDIAPVSVGASIR